jgi:hypothetical protein
MLRVKYLIFTQSLKYFKSVLKNIPSPVDIRGIAHIIES